MSTSRAPGPRRILYVEANEDGTVGGSHRCLLDLVRNLDRTRYDPVVLFYQSNPYVERIAAAGAEVHVWEDVRARERKPLGRLRRTRLALRLGRAVVRRARFLRRARIDLVHANNLPVPACEDWLPAARIVRAAAVAHCRAELRPESSFRLRLAGRFDRIVAISRTVEQSLLRSGLPAERVTLVHDGIDLEALRARARTDPAVLRSTLGVGDAELLVVHVGNLRAWKGQHVLIDALARLEPALRSRTRALFIGDADVHERAYADSLRERSAAAGLNGCVRFLGARDDAADLMHAADVVVHSSTIPEPFGLVVVEGIALGRAVVASRLGGPAEILTPGSGLLFDPARPEELSAALERLAADAPLRRSLGAAGRLRAETFGIAACRDRIQAIYAEVL